MKKIIITLFTTYIFHILTIKNVEAVQTINGVTVATIGDFESIFRTLLNVSGVLLGMTLFLMIVIGGVRYLFSAGDPKALQAAKGTLTWAILGIALFTISFTIILLIQAFTGVQLTVFRIGVE